MNYKTTILLIVLSILSIINPVSAYQWNDFSGNPPIISGNTITDHNNFVYSSTADGIYNINYGNGRNTFFGFALSGTVSGSNFIKFTSDYSWDRTVSTNGDNIDVSVINDAGNWKTDFAFTPYSTKVTNNLTNNLPVAIFNAKFYYIFSVNQGDSILYNNVNYTIPSTPNIHLSGDLTNNIPSFKINGDMIFDFQDLIDNGFTITDLYLKPASALEINYNGNIVAVGFTKNSGVILSGETITIDPTLSNGDFESGASNWIFVGNGSYGIVSPGYDGIGNMARVSLTSGGTADQLYQYGFPLEPYTPYRFSIVANSTSGSNIDFRVHKHNSPYTDYGLNEINVDLTTDLERYTYDFTTTGFASTTIDDRMKLYIGAYGQNSEKYYFDDISLEPYYTPPTPVSLSQTQGNFWINHSWSPGTGNTTDGYNISVNGNWYNSTNAYNNTTVSAHGWSNITVYSWNSSAYNGTMNSTGTSLNTQLDNNPPAIGNISATYTVPVGNSLSIYPSSSDLDNDTLTFATDANKGTFSSSNGSLSWTPIAGDEGTYNWYINVSDGYGSTDTFYFGVSVDSNEPGTPLNLTASTGNFWINHTWNQSVNTDSFNVSVNGVWTNGTTATSNNSTLSPHGYSNITVFGYNSTSDTLGNSTSLNSQVPNNNPTLESMSISASSITTSQTLTITAVNASDLDGDNVTIVNVSVLFNLGGTTNYSMTNTANTSNWTYGYTSGTAGSYTITAFYLSDNFSASNVYIAASQAFTVTTPATSGSGSSGSSGSGTAYINQTNITNATIPSKYQAPPTINLNTISTDPTGIMILWGLLGLSIIWFIRKITQANGSVTGLLLPIIMIVMSTRLLDLW